MRLIFATKPTGTMQTIKIFLASSGELRAERDAVFKFKETVAKSHTHLHLEIVEWEIDRPSGSVGAGRIQDAINPLLADPDCKIVFALFYSKAGEFTVEEFRLAERLDKKVFVYFKAGFSPTDREQNKLYDKVLVLREQLEHENRNLFKDYSDLTKFELFFKDDLHLHLSQHFSTEKTTSPTTPSVWQQKILANNPFPPPEFMEDSRDAVIREIREQTAGAHKTVVLHAEGGAGKTSILAKFCEQHGDDYPHIIWINCGQQTVVHAVAGDFKLVDALRPAMPRWRDEWEAQQKFEHLVDTLAADGRSGLLLLDNANENAHLAHCRRAFEEKLARWTCLITSRDPKTGFRQVLPVGPLDADFAHKLFVRHWLGDGAQPSADDAERLRRLLARIHHHALLTEILAKHLRACREEGNTVRLEDLLRRLSTEGILGLPRTDAVEVEWQGAVGTPRQILEKLFDLAQLDEVQQTRLLQLALLPDAPMPMDLLLPVFCIARDAEPEGYEAFKAELENLAARGWLGFAKGAGYRTHPLVGEFVRGLLLPDFERCRLVVENLTIILEKHVNSEGSDNLKDWVLVGEEVFKHLRLENNNELKILGSWVSTIYSILFETEEQMGNINEAKYFFEKSLQLKNLLYHKI
jgi:hypothetical protein